MEVGERLPDPLMVAVGPVVDKLRVGETDMVQEEVGLEVGTQVGLVVDERLFVTEREALGWLAEEDSEGDRQREALAGEGVADPEMESVWVGLAVLVGKEEEHVGLQVGVRVPVKDEVEDGEYARVMLEENDTDTEGGLTLPVSSVVGVAPVAVGLWVSVAVDTVRVPWEGDKLWLKESVWLPERVGGVQLPVKLRVGVAVHVSVGGVWEHEQVVTVTLGVPGLGDRLPLEGEGEGDRQLLVLV